MILEDGLVTLRDLQRGDIEKRIYWETVETEWQLWDGPWEYEGLTDAQRKLELERYVERLERQAAENEARIEGERRSSFQICLKDGAYIGWCGSYRIDSDCLISEDGGGCAVGISIPETSARKKGCAAHALRLFIDYLRARGECEIYTQTWSGNIRMIGLAEKLGFREFMRKEGFRTVRGEKYDGLTFRLDPEAYALAAAAL